MQINKKSWITVSDLANAQRRHSHETLLKDNLGDGYLYTHNSLFHAVRSHALRIGVKYSSQVNLYSYHACHHLSFASILKNKKVPYFKNEQCLYKLQSIAPELPVQKILEIKKNKVLHESAHLIAQDILDFRSNSLNQTLGFVLSTLLSESFASACETTGYLFVEDPIHTWMYQQNTNSFGCEGEDFRKIIRGAQDGIGQKNCLKFSTLCFLHWNFGQTRLETHALNRIISLCDEGGHLPAQTLRVLNEFSEYHFRVRNRFRNEVAEYYFLSQGIHQPLSELYDFDFLQNFETDDSRTRQLDRLCEAVIHA